MAIVWLEEVNRLELLAEGSMLGGSEGLWPFCNPPLRFLLREALDEIRVVTLGIIWERSCGGAGSRKCMPGQESRMLETGP